MPEYQAKAALFLVRGDMLRVVGQVTHVDGRTNAMERRGMLPCGTKRLPRHPDPIRGGGNQQCCWADGA